MCTRGVFQLRKLSVYFCDFGGSSAGLRETMGSPLLKQFMSDNPHIEFNFILKRNHHPFVTGAYLNGYLKDVPLRSLAPPDILDVVRSLRNQLGRRSLHASGPRTYHPTHSVQGRWMPNMFNSYPRAELETTYHIPRAHLESMEKKIVEDRFLQKKDPANVLLKLDEVNAKDRI